MPIDDTCDAGGAFSADALQSVARQLTEASQRLGVVGRTCTVLAAETDWQTSSARRFHDSVAIWSAEGVGLGGRMADVASAVEWARLRAVLREGGWC